MLQASTALIPAAMQTFVMYFVGLDPFKRELWHCLDPEDSVCQDAKEAAGHSPCQLPVDTWDWTDRSDCSQASQQVHKVACQSGNKASPVPLIWHSCSKATFAILVCYLCCNATLAMQSCHSCSNAIFVMLICHSRGTFSNMKHAIAAFLQTHKLRSTLLTKSAV